MAGKCTARTKGLKTRLFFCKSYQMASKKEKVILEIFESCMKEKRLVFDNDLVKRISKKHEFGNPFDATKIDNSDELPDLLKEADYFIVHLGEGRHQFVKGINIGFHIFEEVAQNNVFDWKYRKSILNEFDTSESNILSIANNQRITHDFLYEDIVENPKVYGSRRTNISASYNIGDETIHTKNLQLEIDLTMELHGLVTVFEGKNGFPNDFAVYQLFHPFKYFTILQKEKQLDVDLITCCYVLRKVEDGRSVLRLYNYTFEDDKNIGSIKLLKNAQYNLIRR